MYCLDEMKQRSQDSSTARRLRDVVRRLIVTHGVLNDAKRPCGTRIPVPHAYALLEMLHHRGPMTVSELAARLTIDRTNVSRLCIRMERNGELQRTADPDDGRARALLLTAAGKRLARAVEAASLGHFANIVEGLAGSTDTVIEALVSLEQVMALAAQGENK